MALFVAGDKVLNIRASTIFENTSDAAAPGLQGAVIDIPLFELKLRILNYFRQVYILSIGIAVLAGLQG